MTNQYSYFGDFKSERAEEPQKKIAQSNISSAAKVYMLSRMQKGNVANGYRSGDDNGQKYMTSEDFITYFQSRGKIDLRPENIAKSTVSTAEVYRSRTVAGPEGEADFAPNVKTNGKRRAMPNVSGSLKLSRDSAASTKKFETPDKDAKIYVPKYTSESTVKFDRNRNSYNETAVFKKVDNEKLEKIKNIADEWMPKDEIVKSKEKRTKSHFSKMILAVASAAISLLMIVTGSVMVSNANKEVKALDNELRELSRTEDELRLTLEMKNDINVLRDRATGDLGMIRKEYVEANYLDMSGMDEIKIYERSSDKKAGLPTILSAFGIN